MTAGVAPPGHRLPPKVRVGPVRLQVTDLARSLDYYEAVLGLRRLSVDGPVARLTPHGTERPLVVLEERPDTRPVGTRGRLGLYHFAILLPSRRDLGAFLQHLIDLGVDPGASDHSVSEALYLRDPDGLGIEVYRDRPRAKWSVAGRELQMHTAPLDGRGVLAAGSADRWHGMPEGTVMGHVHLHVGDLAEAEHFYHAALGLDKMVWSYPGALFLSAGGYHHHLGLNTWAGAVPPAGELDARLLEWTLDVPSGTAVAAVARSLEGAGYEVAREGHAILTRDPSGTPLRVTALG
ncbi:VOC family protein [Gaopeijia maritima]|uniref:VOC family protein n=1 Tax=Gaopeijia maritima TaxID=3119007 RepID=A0ABU9E481_9BACT